MTARKNAPTGSYAAVAEQRQKEYCSKPKNDNEKVSIERLCQNMACRKKFIAKSRYIFRCPLHTGDSE